MSKHIATALRNGRGDPKKLIVAIPPILVSDTERYFSPVQDVMLQHGDVLYISYTADGFDAHKTAWNIAGAIWEAIDQGDYEMIVYLGSSLGGTLIPLIVANLDSYALNGRRSITTSMMRALIYDAPSGIKSMFGLVNRVFAQVLIKPFPERPWLEQRFGTVLNGLLIGPKPKNLEEWNVNTDYSFLDTQPTNREERDQLVHDFAMNNMREAVHSSIRRYIQQVRWLTAPWAGGKNNLSGVHTTYVACVSSANETVIQPLAADEWVRRTGCEVVKLDKGAHVALNEQPTLYRDSLGQLLTSLAALIVRYRPTPLRSRSVSFVIIFRSLLLVGYEILVPTASPATARAILFSSSSFSTTIC